MPLIAAEDVLQAKRMDLLTYLQNYEPEELVRISGNTYCTREHDSLKISNGKWYWFSRNIGGTNALNYLIKVKGYSFIQAVETILGRAAERPPVFCAQKQKEHRDFLMPKLSDDTSHVERYLSSRGIHPVIIRYCIEHKTLFESEEYHNALFVGYDRDGIPRYGALRGTAGQYKGELSGSDKHFSFSIGSNTEPKEIHVFESAIDAMSYATLELIEGRDWKSEVFLSLAGVYQTKRENVVPVALRRFLEEHPTVKTIFLHLDNDEIGRGAVQGIVSGLQGQYTVLDEPPSCGKDVNDELKIRVGIMRKEKEEER